MDYMFRENYLKSASEFIKENNLNSFSDLELF